MLDSKQFSSGGIGTDRYRVGHGNGVRSVERVLLSFLCLIAPIALLATGNAFAQQSPGSAVSDSAILWINPLALLPGDPSLSTSFNAVSSGIGGGLSGLVVHSTTTGSQASTGGIKVVEAGLQVPLGYIIQGVRVCYESTSSQTSIVQIRLSQLQDPPSKALVVLDDATAQPAPGPICVNSASTNVDPGNGAVFLDLRLYFNTTNDRIVIRGLGLLVSSWHVSGDS